MAFSPVLVLHICSGTLGLFSGGVAASFRKGSERHRLAGNVFVISMLSLAASGVYMALLKSQPGNVFGGALTFYLVATAWWTGRRREEAIGVFDFAGLLVISVVAAVTVTLGLEAATSQTGTKYGYPPGPYFLLGSVALIAAVGDVRMLVRRGISGTQRIRRHLWRMCFAWFIASASIFLARPHLFPLFMRKTGMLLMLSFLPLIVMIFWLIRVRATKSRRKASISSAHDAYSLQT
jgi:hypothetical protein